MKKLLSALLVLSVLASLTACGMKTESSLISTQQAAAIDAGKTEADAINVSENETSAAGLELETRQAFGKVLWDAYQPGMLPDGSKLDYASMEGAAENSFSIADIDGGAQAWDRNYWESYEFSGRTFPETIDADGDGIVYFIFPADWDGHYKNVPLVDAADYEQWSKSYLDGAEELCITAQKLTEENIAVLGYPKPEVPAAQPTG